MKKTILFSLGLLVAGFASAQIKIGENVPDIPLAKVLNTKVKPVGLASLKGKVIWLEFWATWCSPCVDAMQKIQVLQKQFAGRLQVITVSGESEKRIGQFLANKPSNLWFDIDTANQFDVYFPYHTIPHAVLIDKNGRVVAITEPENITTKIIADVIAGRQINLPLKEDNMVTNPFETYFHASDTVTSRLLIEPEIKGLGSMSKVYPFDTVFKNRRITMINLSLEGIYRIAYHGLPYGRILDLTPKIGLKKDETMYCLDIIVPKGQEGNLFVILIKGLQARFDLKAAIEKQERDVYILSVADTARVNQLKISTAAQEDLSANHGSFNGQDIKLSKIADYLESFGVVKKPVVDETGIDKKYDIAFDYQPEKDGSLTDALNNLGLRLDKGKRKIDILVFR